MSEPADSSPNLEELTPEEASRIIHSHRKVRYGTSWDSSHNHDTSLQRRHVSPSLGEQPC